MRCINEDNRKGVVRQASQFSGFDDPTTPSPRLGYAVIDTRGRAGRRLRRTLYSYDTRYERTPTLHGRRIKIWQKTKTRDLETPMEIHLYMSSSRSSQHGRGGSKIVDGVAGRSAISPP